MLMITIIKCRLLAKNLHVLPHYLFPQKIKLSENSLSLLPDTKSRIKKYLSAQNKENFLAVDNIHI